MSAVQGGASGPGTSIDLDNIGLKRVISETEVDSKKMKGMCVNNERTCLPAKALASLACVDALSRIPDSV